MKLCSIEHDDLEAQNWETVGAGFGTNVGFPQIGHPTPTKTLLKLEAENQETVGVYGWVLGLVGVAYWASGLTWISSECCTQFTGDAENITRIANAVQGRF